MKIFIKNIKMWKTYRNVSIFNDNEYKKYPNFNHKKLKSIQSNKRDKNRNSDETTHIKYKKTNKLFSEYTGESCNINCFSLHDYNFKNRYDKNTQVYNLKISGWLGNDNNIDELKLKTENLELYLTNIKLKLINRLPSQSQQWLGF